MQKIEKKNNNANVYVFDLLVCILKLIAYNLIKPISCLIGTQMLFLIHVYSESSACHPSNLYYQTLSPFRKQFLHKSAYPFRTVEFTYRHANHLDVQFKLYIWMFALLMPAAQMAMGFSLSTNQAIRRVHVDVLYRGCGAIGRISSGCFVMIVYVSCGELRRNQLDSG